MGEIGIDRKEYLYVLSYCDMVLISRGYDRRNRHLWSATRWETFHLMMAFVGSNKLAESGIFDQKDLITFPWEKKQEETKPMTEEDRKDLQADIDAFNAFMQSKNVKP